MLSEMKISKSESDINLYAAPTNLKSRIDMQAALTTTPGPKPMNYYIFITDCMTNRYLSV